MASNRRLAAIMFTDMVDPTMSVNMIAERRRMEVTVRKRLRLD